MNDIKLIFSKNHTNNIDIKSHLERCNNDFVPKLSNYINIEKYAIKIYEKANRYEIFYKDKLIGLCAVYLNDDNAFVSNFSIENKMAGTGLSHKLMEFCLNDIRKMGIVSISLEVFKSNKRAIKFYNKNNFITIKETTQKLTLKKEL